MSKPEMLQMKQLFISRENPRSSSFKEPEETDHQSDRVAASPWSTLLPELVGEIVRQVDENEEQWPQRQIVVSCACVCKKWRHITKEIVGSRAIDDNSRIITFPSCLKQPGPCDFPNQCLIKRDKKTSTFYLYLALTPSFTDKGKFLLAAKRYRCGAYIEYIISLDADDLSQGSNANVGKIRSNFLGTDFKIYDGQPPHKGAKPSCKKSTRQFATKQISPQAPLANLKIGSVSYKFNLFRSKGPRRMVCAVKRYSSVNTSNDQRDPESSMTKKPEYAILKNKAPRWHDHLQCWCLNFHSRVTVASVKNFQLVETLKAAQNQGRPIKGSEETVVLQFGKVADDIFTLDYMNPLSAFQAFAICLTSFGRKLACE